jgi:hypothetical protein
MIKLTKIDINPNSEVIQASNVEEYRIDQERGTWGQFFEGKSPPVDYWIVGELIGEIQVGKAILIDRWNRNGVVIRGTMHTSEVKKLEENDGVTYITTANSLYKMEQVDDEDILNYEREMLQLQS